MQRGLIGVTRVIKIVTQIPMMLIKLINCPFFQKLETS